MDKFKPELVVNNARPEPAKPRRTLPKVSPYCPVCGGSTWMMVNQGPANRVQEPGHTIRPVRRRCCLYCLAKGKVTTW